MTLGQRIQEQRKKMGLSQEALGEALGVSRQAISKWEGDLTIPELDKLIALSRLFGLSVGRLLGVEEPAEGTECRQEELSPRERELAETVAQGCLRQAEAGRARRAQRNRRLAAAAAALLALAIAAGGWLLGRSFSRMNGRIIDLEHRVLELDQAVDSQFRELLAQAESQSVREGELVEGWSYTLDGVDYGGQCRLTLWVTPKHYTQGDSAALVLQAEGREPVHAQGQWEDWRYRFEVQLPAAEEVEPTFYLRDAQGAQRPQVLSPITDLARRTRLDLQIQAEGSRWAFIGGQWSGKYQISWTTDSAYGEDFLDLKPEKFQLRLVKNGEILERWELDSHPLRNSTRYSGETTWEYSLQLEQAGDEYALAYWMEDNLGQQYQGDLVRFAVEEGKRGLEAWERPLEAQSVVTW